MSVDITASFARFHRGSRHAPGPATAARRCAAEEAKLDEENLIDAFANYDALHRVWCAAKKSWRK